MIFQLDYATVITFVLISYLATSLILFIAGTYIMQMYASSKKWDDSFSIPLKINIIWLIITLAIGISLLFFVGDTIFIDYMRVGINTIVGLILVMRYYEKEWGESIQLVLVTQVILFIIAILFGSIFGIVSLDILVN